MLAQKVARGEKPMKPKKKVRNREIKSSMTNDKKPIVEKANSRKRSVAVFGEFTPW